MLNRLMFVYFIQKKGFLDGDPNYLRNRLKRVREARGKRQVPDVLPLLPAAAVPRGLGQVGRNSESSIRTWNACSGVCRTSTAASSRSTSSKSAHATSTSRRGLRATLRLLRPLRMASRRPAAADRQRDQPRCARLHLREVHQPEADGGLLHQGGHHRVHQQEHDHSVPVRRRAQKKCAIAFQPDSSLWRLLRDDPDRYIYAAVRHGVLGEDGAVLPLPLEIAEGVADVSKRGGWNRPATEPFGSRRRPGENTSRAGRVVWRSETS